MELRHLRYFVAVAEELNFRRAAERLFMAQPPLSRQIQQLEAEIGVLLFQRVKKRVELTAAGEVFLEEARRTLTQADQAVRAAQQASRGDLKSLNVGCCVSKCSDAFDNAFPGFMRAFRKRRPDVEITLMEMCSPTQTRALNERQIDVGFLQIPITNETLESLPLLAEPLVLALPQDHPLANWPNVPLCALAQERFLSFPHHVYPALHEEIEAACVRAGFRPHILQEVETAQAALNLVGTGMGITFAIAVATGVAPPGVIYRDIEDFPRRLELSIAWRQDNFPPLLAEFIALAQAMF